MAEPTSAPSRRAINSQYLWIEEERKLVHEVEGSYDIFLCLASWEKRGAAVASFSQIETKSAIVTHFNPSHAPEQVIREAVSEFREALVPRSRAVFVEPLNRSTSYLESLDALKNAVDRAHTLFSSPRIAIDISSMPIGYIQGLSAWLLTEKKSHSVDFFYTEPVYAKSHATSAGQFTAGSWRVSPVPYLEGTPSGSIERSIIVCIGAESDNARELLLGRDYSSVAIVKPESSVALEWGEKMNRDCDELVAALDVVGNACFSCSPFSIVGVIEYYQAQVLPQWRGRQRLLVAVGPKPHGLAGAICGIVDPGLNVVSRVPSGYVVRNVEAGSYCWRYKVRDLSSPTWAADTGPTDWGKENYKLQLR